MCIDTGCLTRFDPASPSFFFCIFLLYEQHYSVVIWRIEMRRRDLFFLLFLVVIATPVFTQSLFNSLLTLKVAPGANIPMGEDSDLFELNYGGNISGEISMPFFPALYTSVDVGYNYVPLRTDITELSLMAFGAGLGLELNPIPTLSIRAFGSGGYYYGFLHNGDDSGGYPYAGGGLGAYVLFSSRFGVGG